MGVRLLKNQDEIKSIDDYMSQRKSQRKNELSASKEVNAMPAPAPLNGVLFSDEDYPDQSESLPIPKSETLKKSVFVSGISGSNSPLNPADGLLAAARSRLKGLSTTLDRDTGHVLYMDDRRCVMSEDVKNKKLFVSDEPSDEDILIMLVAAQEKYGEKFKLFGTDDFIERCTEIALVHQIKMQENTPAIKQRMG